jgi:carotenoid cleavage dioxygenase-like enzyme
MSQRRRQDLMSRVVNDEILILDRAAGRVHRFNPTATYIWHACDGLSASEIAVRMAQDFDVAPEMVLDDINATLSDFRRLGLVLDVYGDATAPTG